LDWTILDNSLNGCFFECNSLHSRCALRPQDVSLFAALLAKQSTLKSIDFSFSNFGQVGLEIANAMKSNSSLTFIGTHAAGIDGATTEAILSAVTTSSTLHGVIVGGVITARTVHSVTKLIEDNTVLKHLTVTSTESETSFFAFVLFSHTACSFEHQRRRHCGPFQLAASEFDARITREQFGDVRCRGFQQRQRSSRHFI
jgi:hypothetical protein